MRRKCLLFLLVISLPLMALATTYTPEGVGGGGWLYAGAINSNNPDIMVVGSDMMGVHRSANGGLTWHPWNTGIPDGEFRATYYIQDLLYVDSPIWSGFFAASVGGVMRARDDADWDHITEPEDYHYLRDGNLEEPWSYPFSCLAFNGVDTVYIGAGMNRWDPEAGAPSWANSWEAYPELSEATFSGSSDGDAQYTVWSYNLTSNGPLQPLTITGNQSGAARDIGARQIDGKDYMVVTTMTGIWLHDGTEWINLSENVQLYYNGQDRGHALDFESDPSLWPWGAHITARGSLYISTIRNENNDLYPGGVYRIFDITADLAEMRFQWVGNDNKLPPDNWGDDGLTLREYGFVPTDSVAHLHNMSVLDGVGDAPDEIYMGDRKNKHGLFRVYQEYLDEELSCNVKHCTWTQWRDGIVTLFSDPDEYIDKGWASDFGTGNLLFKPALAATPEGTRVLVQFSGRLHVSNDSGETFINSYCTEVPDTDLWQTKGYNELAVVDMDFDQDGRLLFGAGDVGNFYEDDTYGSYYDYLAIPLDQDATNEDDYAWTREGGYVTTVANWSRTGQTALFVQKGRGVHATAPSKLFMRHPDVYDGEWKNITSELDELDHYVFGDLIVVKDTTIFMAYKWYPDPYVGQGWSEDIEEGVLKGVYQENGSWIWDEFSEGLSTTNSQTWVFQLLYNSFSKRVFAATERGLFVLDGLRDGDWEKVPEEVILDKYSHTVSLAQSEKGKEIFAGTSSSWDYSKTGTLLKCTNPGADIADMQWQPMINTDPDDYHFEFGDPYCLPEAMDGRADEALPQLRALAVSPGTDDTVFVGLRVYINGNAAFMKQEGIWVYNRSDCGIWEHFSLGTAMEGVSIRSLAFDPTDSNSLYIGTDGMGIQVLDVSTLPIISCTPQKPGKGP